MSRVVFAMGLLLVLAFGTTAAQDAGPPPEGPPPVLLLQGDVAAGAQIAESVCYECHTADGSSIDPDIPRIAGQFEDYLKLQLFVFKEGARPGTEMNEIAGDLTLQQIADVAAFLAQQEPNGVSWPGQDQALVGRGATVYNAGVVADNVIACAICHGPTGDGIAATGAPRIFGQAPGYLKAILTEFATVPDFGVPAPNAMHVIASNISQADFDAVVAFLASQHWERAPAGPGQ